MCSAPACKTKAWGLEQVPENRPFITAASHITMFDVRADDELCSTGPPPRLRWAAEMVKWAIDRQVVPVGRHAAGAASFGKASRSKRPD